MPIHWTPRTLEPLLKRPGRALDLFPVWLLLGPRQVGKSSLLNRCATAGRRAIDLDDLDVRARANQDPELFMRGVTPPFLIDEIQYAPQLLSPIKRIADRAAAPGAVWLTGSQNFAVMEGVTETLAGRAAIINLFGLSDEEKGRGGEDPAGYFRRLAESSFPKLRGVEDAAARELYLSSYVQTYIERDVRELLRIEKRREFEIFLKMCALRTAQIVNYDALAKDAGVSPATAKDWLGLLEDSFLIRLVEPFHTNRNKRLIKSPKLHFIDAGLAAHLAGWRTPESLRLGPMGGAAFESHVFGQILRRFRHRLREVEFSFWRTRDGQEIDLLVEASGRCFPVEIKMGRPQARSLPSLKSIAHPNWARGQVVSLSGGREPVAVAEDWDLVSPAGLRFADA
ncbi:MAG: ATP-binding protein [Elusimicrobia bacterium]|nr:ATP-binding protein [Elusimicrobiota bacterium]